MGELSTSGITKLIKAEAICEEMVMVDEQVEVDDDADQNVTNATVDAENATTEESGTEKSETEAEAKVETEAKTEEAAEATTEDNATAESTKEEPIVVEGNA